MAVTNYYTVNGAIIGEKTAGGSRADYLTDALGNVTATVNQSGQVVNTYRYKPYGAQLAKTGIGADPAFQWVGQQGYRQAGKKYSDVYVRARHYDTKAARWTTVDPLTFELLWWRSRLRALMLPRHHYSLIAVTSGHGEPRNMEFVYAQSNPTTAADPSGRQGGTEPPPGNATCDYSQEPEGHVILQGIDTGQWAITMCDKDTGKVWTKNCWIGCARECVDAHEGEHRHDQGECCARVALCKKHHYSLCDDRFHIWFRNNQMWRECRGNLIGAGCDEGPLHDLNCWRPNPGVCCGLYRKHWQNDRTNALGGPGRPGYCRNIPNPWGDPPYRCPFNTDGSYRGF